MRRQRQNQGQRQRQYTLCPLPSFLSPLCPLMHSSHILHHMIYQTLCMIYHRPYAFCHFLYVRHIPCINYVHMYINYLAYVRTLCHN
ncbi:hypothetical protein B484DRAFT_446112 [Ochromonadaceae sp. CCMP2298]|nr:hypothetical protein B484DRAFT_446112 [Ochromonadaceae sp. CCMP2298]